MLSGEVFVEHEGTHMHGSGGSFIDGILPEGEIFTVKYRVTTADGNESFILARISTNSPDSMDIGEVVGV